jgi:RHS repeat-associated protein
MDDKGENSSMKNSPSVQVPTLPRGGGAIKSIEEKFQVNAVSGTSSFSIPLPLSPSRHGFQTAIGLGYNSGSGNSPFGLGWKLDVPSIERKTERALPQYRDDEESDTFILSGTEDLVPLMENINGQWTTSVKPRTEGGTKYTVTLYRPRIEGLFARIEKWKDNVTNVTHWRTISSDNTHAYYGLTQDSRLVNPNDHTQVFQWLLCRTHDDKGNITVYRYKKEDFANVPAQLSERNRINNCTQVYLKEILYGTRKPYFIGDALPVESDFLFRTVFDYGEHDAAEPIPKDVDVEKHPWQSRKDPFSSYRSGFEIRTYRRCSRVLMFHCFDVTELPHTPYLVKSLELVYDDELDLKGAGRSIKGFSYLIKARQCGHKWDAAANHYLTKRLPDFEFAYQQHEWNTALEKVSPEDSAHAPLGIDYKQYLWIDLFSEGISGILTEQAGGWFYKSNLGQGRFSHAKAVAPKPSFSGLSTGVVTIQELEGNGIKYLVNYEDEPRGFFKLTPDEEWEPFKYFSSYPHLGTRDPNMRPIDLSGDGRADLLITEDNALRWYPSLGEKGFEVSQTIAREIDDEKGPAVIFADQTQSVFLTDMGGDGLTDIVRVRNGEICYWPNLGYGRFGAKVNMENAPLFDHPDRFNPAYLRLADIDGSGTTDIVYLGTNEFRVWMNLSGNAWTPEPEIIPAFPQINNLADVSVLDFLGSGTACIVYSSALSQYEQHPLQYIDLMGSRKPHLLVGYQNNCGKEVSLEYRSSAHFYLDDKKEGRAWSTKLPFPVHCISKVRVEDKIRETIFTNSYRYSHGYFDYEEREFRGFARVEQLDTEEFSRFKINAAKNVVEEALHQPPVKTISWFHTGAFLGKDKILHQSRSEYFQNDLFDEYDLPEPFITDELTVEELREALRACKGLSLRSEVYALDNSSLSDKPYSASHSTFEIRTIQPKKEQKHACFLIIPSESVSYGYERNPADPRISHSFVLEADEFGNVTKSASVVYPRVKRPLAPNNIPDKVWEEQDRLHVMYGEQLFTDDINEDETYRLRVGHESRLYEVSGINKPPGFFLHRKEIFDQIKAATRKSFEEDFTAGLQKRLSKHSRSYLLKDDLSGPLHLGKLSSLGIIHKSYQLAYTKELVTKYFGAKVTDQMLTDAGYVHSEGDDGWWAHTGTDIYDANPRLNFYTPVGARDIFGNESFVEHDKYILLVKSGTDAIKNKVAAVNDYRTLAPVMVIDPNLNRAVVETDELGLVIKTAVMGKEGAGDGDTLADPTARMEYDLFNWQNHRKPNHAHTFVREVHGPANPRWQESYVYSDGGGDVIMTKAQAEPGKAGKWNAVTKQVDEVNANPRWIGNGRTILNNKGNPVKQYEPYFSDTHEYESEDALVETGITPVLYYDPLGRNIRTEYPNGTFARSEFDSWYLKTFDVNDTVKDSQWYADRGSPNPALVPEPAAPEQRAAWLAAKHYDTPETIHTDSSGRTIYTTADYGDGKTTSVRSESDPLGRYTKAFDQLGRNVSESYTNLLGSVIYGISAEKGERWVFTDVMGRPVKIWDNNAREFRSTFDQLHRPVSTFVMEGGKEILFAHVVYGEVFADAAQRNMKGRTYQFYDQAGVLTIKKVDFKGNVIEIERKLAKAYELSADWSTLEGLDSVSSIEAAAASLLDTEAFSSSSAVDALNRPTSIELPDQSLVEPKYNEANLLDSLRVKIHGEGSFITFLENQDYDAKGQRQFAQYGNGLITNYSYDPKTLRLQNLLTKKIGTTDAQSQQNLRYTFDPVGNIVQVNDDAQQTHYFQNAVVLPESKYEYDALYQLVKATCREHAGLGGNAQRDDNDLPYIAQLPHLNDLSAVRRCTELYQYDDCGNILQLQHIATGAGWTQRYRYEYQDESGNVTNRLKSTSLPSDPDAGPYSAIYQHDQHGNMTKMPHLNELVWNFMDQLAKVNLGGGGFAFFVYGLSGKRIRKVIERPGGKKIERIYLGSVEIYREYQGSTKKLERSTLHVSDNTGRIAQVNTKLLDEDDADPANPLDTNLIRYQYTNHLGSATMETDELGNVISYEEYHPYGTSAYRSSQSSADLSLKRYRFSGKERDAETGLYYFGARYYAAWLGRWNSSDPAGFVDGMNCFQYCRNNPVLFTDPNGTDTSMPNIAAPHKAAPHRRYVPGRRRDRLTPRSTVAEREAFTERGGFRIVDPHPEQQRWVGTPQKGHWQLSPEGVLERLTPESPTPGNDAPTPPPSPPPVTPTPAPPAEAPSGPPALIQPGSPTGVQNGGQTGASSGRRPNSPQTGNISSGFSENGRNFFTSSFWRGLAIGLLVTVAVIAVIATGGAILAAVAPAAATFIAASGAGTALAVVGVGLTTANIVQAVRQRDLGNNPISEEQANYNLGLGVGSLVGGSVAGPLSGSVSSGTSRVIQGLGQGGGGGFAYALEGGGAIAGAISRPIANAAPLAIPGVIGGSAGTTVLMMSGRGRGGDDDDFAGSERIGRGGRNRPRSNQAQNEQFKAVADKYGLSKSEQRTLHDYIQGEDLGYEGLERSLLELFPGRLPR